MASDKQQELNQIFSSFHIKANCVNHKKIRHISQYDIQLPIGTRVKEITKFSDEISLAMRAKTKPLLSIIPVEGIVRLQVADEGPHKLPYFQSLATTTSPGGTLPMFLGSSSDGQDLWIDAAENPHMLVAGTTGSGKSTLLHTIIANMFGRDDVMINIIDTKNVEFAPYAGYPNVNIATNYTESLSMMVKLHAEMEMRYKILNQNRNIQFNSFDMPKIILIIDEYADLIMQDTKKQFYTYLCMLAQKSRAANIFCILATQRPSADILRGTIKANFPARLSCQVASRTDSRVVLDMQGAEHLAGKGDAIIKTYKYNYQRMQIAYTTPEEVIDVYKRSG